MVWADISKLNRDKTEQSLNRTELKQNRSSYIVWTGVSKLNRDRTDQSLNRTELEQNRSSYMVWAGITKQNRVRTEQVELHDLGGRFETEQS